MAAVPVHSVADAGERSAGVADGEGASQPPVADLGAAVQHSVAVEAELEATMKCYLAQTVDLVARLRGMPGGVAAFEQQVDVRTVISSVLASLKLFPRNEALATASMDLLSIMICSRRSADAAIDLGVVEAALTVIRTYAGCANACAFALASLSCIVREAPDRRDQLGAACIASIINAFQMPHDDSCRWNSNCGPCCVGCALRTPATQNGRMRRVCSRWQWLRRVHTVHLTRFGAMLSVR